jgi:alpha-tubulin suppressor-like RCC1 family protein
MKTKIILLLFLFHVLNICKAQKVLGGKWPGQNWVASFMTGGASASTFRHFLLLPNGTLEIFAPGETPQPFPGIDHVVAISAGTFHILALKSDGTIWAWGSNDDRQLGNAALAKSLKRSDVPVQVTGITNAIAISAKGANSYALLADSTVWAWGNGNVGMTGDGGKMSDKYTSSNWSGRSVPVKVQSIHNAIAISGPMALLADGTIMTWGDGGFGRLGNGSTESTVVPVKVTGINNAVAIAYRENGALALLADGTVWAWGKNYKGQLGNGAKNIDQNDGSNVPVQVKNITNAVAISAHNVCMALLKDGTVRVWGWGAVGGMGQGRPGSMDVNSIPLKVPGVDNVIAINAGNGYGMALKKDGTLMGWGGDMVATGVYHQTWKPVVIAQIKMP